MTTKTYGALMIPVLALLSIFPPLATDMYLPALGAVASDLHASASATELSISMFFLGLCFGQILIGPMIDAYGRKLPLMLTTLVFTLSSLMLLFVQDIVTFNILRFIQALGACGGMVISRAIVTDLYEGQDAAKIMTILVMLMTIGPIVSPTLGSVIFTHFGWHSIFILLVCIGVSALILSKIFISETLPQEKRVQRPFIDAFANATILVGQPSFIIPVLTAGLAQAGMFSFITGSSHVFQSIFGLNSLHYGLAFAAIAISLFIYGNINKVLLNRYTPVKILGYGLPLYVVMSFMTTCLSSTTSLWIYMTSLWLTIGFVSLISSNGMALAMGAARERAGTGSALLGVFQFGLAFIVSSSVALSSGSHSALPMSLGIFVPAVLSFVIWLLNQKRIKIKSHS